MTAERTHAGHQTRYELHDETGLSCVLTYTADPERIRRPAGSRPGSAR